MQWHMLLNILSDTKTKQNKYTFSSQTINVRTRKKKKHSPGTTTTTKATLQNKIVVLLTKIAFVHYITLHECECVCSCHFSFPSFSLNSPSIGKYWWLNCILLKYKNKQTEQKWLIHLCSHSNVFLCVYLMVLTPLTSSINK